MKEEQLVLLDGEQTKVKNIVILGYETGESIKNGIPVELIFSKNKTQKGLLKAFRTNDYSLYANIESIK